MTRLNAAVATFGVLILMLGIRAQANTDFALIDSDGEFHNMSWYNDKEKIALLVADADSSEEVKAAFFAKVALHPEMQFFILNPTGESRDTVHNLAHADVAVLMDDAKIVSKSLGVTELNEVLFLDVKTFKVTKQAAVVSEQEITYEWGTPSYVSDVAPIIENNCAMCHRDGGVAPFSMDSHLMLKGWSPMIKEVIATKRMPPGQLDPHVGSFTNSRTLSVEDQQKLIAWIDAGTPNDATDVDPLAEITWPDTKWDRRLGEPDLIVKVPPMEIPATGVLDYIDITVDMGLEEDRWVRASEWIPSAPSVLHHSLNALVEPGKRGGSVLAAIDGRTSDMPDLAAYVPGGEASIYPENAGGLLKAGTKMALNLHYTTNGKAETDESEIGVWFYPKGYVPEERITGICACIFPGEWVNIPPNDPSYVQVKKVTYQNKTELQSFLPHMHFRGKSMKAYAEYPDGTEEMLINVANYSYDWQLAYEFSPPKILPAGTVVRVEGEFDNSTRNPANPDPERSVPWGQMSWDEMFFGAMTWKNVE
jgi:hypothetical protein